MTLALPKRELRSPGARDRVVELERQAKAPDGGR
jgi:hypothetical protein